MVFGRLSILVALAVSQLATAASIEKRTVTCPTGQTTANEACCVLFPVIDLLQEELFDGGECGEEAHAALRLAFHDAIGFSKNGGKGGGADGSILAFHQTETTYAANSGIEDIITAQLPIFQKTNLTAGDFVHLAAAIGTGNCPGSPQLAYSFGRPPPVAPAPDGTVPEPTDSVTDILARFSEAGFVTAEVIWLLASHSIAAASKIDTSAPRTPFDSTPALFDTQFYLETILNGTLLPGDGQQHTGEVLSPIAGEMRLQSDFAFAQDPRTACLWQEPINDQAFIQGKFFAAMKKLQVLGQTGLTDCSDVIPVPASLPGPITFPAGFSEADVISACTATPLPSLATIAGPKPTIPPVPLR
ncbi:manganese peroxidase [Agrocybe pediades]|nr:manganese peroxidase [Agrocybe pediades]